MKQTRLYALFLVFCAVCAAWAQDVTLRQAEGIAADFFKSRGIKSTAPQKARRRTAARQNGNSPYYIFNNSDESAFVIVSGDSRTRQVLAYSLSGAFHDDDLAPGEEYLLGMYEAYINGLQDGTVQPTQSRLSAPTTKVIETAKWNQNPSFWWDECPVVDGKHTYAGCVATAMAILMRHYEWPKRGFGSKSYTSKTLGLNLSANFGEIDYNWASLPKGTEKDSGWNDANKKTVAKILKQCGVAADMDYNVYGSAGSSASTYYAAIGLYRYFGYKLGAYFYRDNFSDEAWLDFIIKEINNNHPVIYSGNREESGHAFICDGYDNEGRLHFNFGWSGKYRENGKYVDEVELKFWDFTCAPFDYRYQQQALIGIEPDYNASSRELCDLYMYDDGIADSTGLKLYNVNKIYLCDFNVIGYNLQNVSDKADAIKVGAFICNNNNRKTHIGTADFDLKKGTLYKLRYVKCTIPETYKMTAGDYICLYSSIDDGATWKKVECYDPQLGMIKMADVYIVTDLLMRVEDGKDAGLTLYTDNHIDLNGKKFKIQCNLLKNMLGVTFKGDVAAFLCDKYGNRKYQIGKSTVDTDKYVSGSRYSTFTLTCTITNDMNVESGDRICVFSRLNGYDWVYVDCEDASKAYITIPESLIVEKEITKFKTAHAAILAKTTSNVTKSDLEAIEKALADYSKLSSVAKAQLTTEKKLLDALKEKAEKAIAGDVNGDGKVNIADATMLVGYIVNNGQATSTSFVKAAADVNGDGKINIADVTAIIKTIVNQ